MEDAPVACSFAVKWLIIARRAAYVRRTSVLVRSTARAWRRRRRRRRGTVRWIAGADRLLYGTYYNLASLSNHFAATLHPTPCRHGEVCWNDFFHSSNSHDQRFTYSRFFSYHYSWFPSPFPSQQLNLDAFLLAFVFKVLFVPNIL